MLTDEVIHDRPPPSCFSSASSVPSVVNCFFQVHGLLARWGFVGQCAAGASSRGMKRSTRTPTVVARNTSPSPPTPSRISGRLGR